MEQKDIEVGYRVVQSLAAESVFGVCVCVCVQGHCDIHPKR